MSTTSVRLPRPSGSSSVPPIKRFSMSDIQTTGGDLPNRYILHAVEGWGKTSLAAQTPKPVFLQSKGETGLETLIRSGQLRETAHLPEIESWTEVKAAAKFLLDEEHGFKTVVVDTTNGLERLCYEFICDRDFDNDWGDKGFGGYQRGYEVSLSEWRMFLNDLDAIRLQKKMTIFLLCHTKVKGFKNPEGSDYDRYAPDMHDKIWGLTHKWADCVLFGNFETLVRQGRQEPDPTKKGKGMGGNFRILYTQRKAAYDAKNRLGLPEEIEMGSSAAEGWTNLLAAIKEGKKITSQEVSTDAQ